MAEIQMNTRKGMRVITVPRIDLTPMVDLGFLLITFFMMATSMREPKAMDIQMPCTPAPPGTTAYYETSAMTLLPATGHKTFYYEGMYPPGNDLKVAANGQELRNILSAKQQSLLYRSKPEERLLQVLIKPHATATVDDIVGLLDEMVILKITHYALVDISPEEYNRVDKSLLSD